MSVGVMKDYKLKQRNLRWVGQVVVTEGSLKTKKKKDDSLQKKLFGGRSA